MILRNKLIHMLGGYTKKEYMRVEQKYQGLLDSNTKDKTPMIVNEYIFRVFKDILLYMKSLYNPNGNSDIWAERAYNAIRNNYMRILCRYLFAESVSIYRFDPTIDKHDEFIKVLQQSGSTDEEIEMILRQIPEND